MMQTESVQMVVESRHALQNVRRALIELYSSIGADPTAPQEVARRLGINRNLTWKLARVMKAPDPFATLNYLPGEQGLDLVLAAFERHGAPPEAISKARCAIHDFTGVVDVHAGDRDQLELTLESMGLFQPESGLEGGRELAFRGSSMVWGAQARTRIALGMVAPSSDAEDATDCVNVAGLVGFRRLRPSASFRLFRSRISSDAGGDMAHAPQELDDRSPGDQPLLLRAFCSPNMPGLDCRDTPEGREFVLPGGPVGNLAAFDCFHGYALRGLPARRTVGNEYGSFAAPVTVPVETLLFDLLLHRAVSPASTPEVLVYGFPHGGPDDPSMQTIQNLMPISATPEELAGSPPAVATPLAPKYAELVSGIYARMGWRAEEFVGLRVRMRFPPMCTRVVVRWPLR